MIDMIKTGHAYVKISAPYLISRAGPEYPDAEPLIHAFIKANPDRILWGSDWPHFDPANLGKPLTEIALPRPIDHCLVLNQLARRVTDPTVRKKILVDNPERLYGFQPLGG
jgi:predicted TIM-barrel fold metal-dependent hydrolase